MVLGSSFNVVSPRDIVVPPQPLEIHVAFLDILLFGIYFLQILPFSFAVLSIG